MTEKLLEKSRNIFISLTPPENLIPKKRIKASKKNRYQKNRPKNLRSLPRNHVSLNALNKFFHEKNHITSTYITNKLTLDNFSLENIIPPMYHSAPNELHFAIGGNINQFLKTQRFHEKKNSSRELATPSVTSKAFPANSSCLQGRWSLIPFFLRWNPGNLSLADFIKVQLYANIWNSLFSSYDLNYVYNTAVKNYKAPIRIKNQHKNELIEYRKIAILYGNLSRNSLTCLMKRSGESKFLSTLERRLDVALKRALFFPTIRAARQWIHQGKILVNNEVCLYNSYLLQPGDLISIKEAYKNIWKKEWFKNFKGFDSFENTPTHIKETPYNLLDSFIGPRERFLFPAYLMRKWDKWCQLWGNSISRRKDSHLWSKWAYTWNLSLHATFNNSVCADNLYLKSFIQLKNNLHKLRYTQRQLTPILFWLEELYRNSFARKKQTRYMYQLISSLLLLQQRGRVTDGLFQQRWNRLFTKKKREMLKKKNCQWGGIKPMHLECSYSCATMVYLFTPQKLVWPSHINVLLLRSALNG